MSKHTCVKCGHSKSKFTFRDMEWRYRFIKMPGKEGVLLYEVAFIDDVPFMASPYPSTIQGDSRTEAKRTYKKIAEAFRHHTLTWREIREGKAELFEH